MKPSEITQALDICLQAFQPVIIWGYPGIGKTQIVHQSAARAGMELRDPNAVTLDPVDLRGMPDKQNGKTVWLTPDFLPDSGRGIFFVDELNRASQMVQNACLRLALEGKIGNYTMPRDWHFVAACNPNGPGTTKMSAALLNRFVHLECEPDIEDWSKWAIVAGIEPAVIAFLRFRPNLLHDFSATSKAFPSPRSWEFVSKITAQHPNPNIEHELFKGTVGDGAAVEYSAFLRLYRQIPSIDGILLNPDKADVPQDAASLFAIASALGRRAADSNIARVIRYLDRIPEEYSVMTIKDAVTRDKTLCATPEFTKWAITHSDVVF